MNHHVYPVCSFLAVLVTGTESMQFFLHKFIDMFQVFEKLPSEYKEESSLSSMTEFEIPHFLSNFSVL
jgi:hypothetical protein